MSLDKAEQVFNNLQQDIQTHIVEEFIKPQVQVDELIQEFDKQLMSEECRSLKWQVLQDVVSKIIKNKTALAQMLARIAALESTAPLKDRAYAKPVPEESILQSLAALRQASARIV